MPRMEFKRIDESKSYTPLPDGKYICKLVDLEEAATKNGDEMWKLRFEVCDETSEYMGRRIFDNMVFSKDAEGRVKFICARMGLDVSEDMDLETKDILEREVIITVVSESYETEDPITGSIVTKQRNKVPWDGYEKVTTGKAAEKPEGKVKANKITIEPATKKADKAKPKTDEEELPF